MQTVTMVITGLSMGITIYVGQKIGEKNQEEAGKAIGAGIVLFCFLDVILAVILAVFAKSFASALHAPQEAYAQTCQYIMVCGIGIVFIGLYNLLGAVFRGIGDSKTPLFTVLIACICNIVGDLVFVAVIGLGAMGAALATVMAQAFSVLISIFIIRKKTLPFTFRREYIRFDRRIVLRELRLGTPIALQELLVGISFLVIQTVVNSIDVFASAGVGVAEKVCGFIMLVPSAISQSMSACGTEYRRQDEREGGKGIVQAHAYLKAYAIDILLTSVLFCYIGYYNGCCNTFFVMLQGIIGAFGVRIPVAFFMSHLSNTTLFHIGLATPISSVCQMILCVIFMLYKNNKEKASIKE